MLRSRPQRYFIVKHDLESFQLLPGFIWRSNTVDCPPAFKQVEIGDCWAAFAYKIREDGESCRLITGFYECVQPHWYGPLPLDRVNKALAGTSDLGESHWMIEGKPYGPQPNGPVSVPPLKELLEKPIYEGVAIVPGITEAEFKRVQQKTLKLSASQSDRDGRM